MSTFSIDEVTFLKSRGNLWCSKVWMGLYDKNRSGALESKDEDALKHHIIQKYEKKSLKKARHNIMDYTQGMNTLEK